MTQETEIGTAFTIEELALLTDVLAIGISIATGYASATGDVRGTIELERHLAKIGGSQSDPAHPWSTLADKMKALTLRVRKEFPVEGQINTVDEGRARNGE